MKNNFLAILMIFNLSGCATFTISKESLVEQLKERQSISETSNILSLGTKYYSNNLQKIKCSDKNDEEVYLYAGKNMNFIITNALTGKAVNLYFDTVYFKDDTLSGLKSRILGGKRSISINDISKIVIQTETKKFDNVAISVEK